MKTRETLIYQFEYYICGTFFLGNLIDFHREFRINQLIALVLSELLAQTNFI